MTPWDDGWREVATENETGLDPVGLDPAGLDPAVLAELYVRHGSELQRFVTGVLGDREAALDVLQSVFVKAVTAGQEIRPDSVKGWLFRVAFNEALEHKRRRDIDERAKRASGMERSKKHSSSPDEFAIRVETIDQVRVALDDLPSEQRAVVRARMYEEKTFAQIAQESGVPIGTVLTRMRLALRKLRTNLSEKA